jgi:hypothetical protein
MSTFVISLYLGLSFIMSHLHTVGLLILISFIIYFFYCVLVRTRDLYIEFRDGRIPKISKWGKIFIIILSFLLSF